MMVLKQNVPNIIFKFVIDVVSFLKQIGSSSFSVDVILSFTRKNCSLQAMFGFIVGSVSHMSRHSVSGILSMYVYSVLAAFMHQNAVGKTINTLSRLHQLIPHHSIFMLFVKQVSTSDNAQVETNLPGIYFLYWC